MTRARTDSGIDSHEVTGYVRHNPGTPSPNAAPSVPSSRAGATAPPEHFLESLVNERVAWHRDAHAQLAWLTRYRPHTLVQYGMDAASLKYTHTTRVDSDGDVLQENHRIEHVALVARSRARNPENRVRVIG